MGLETGESRELSRIPDNSIKNRIIGLSYFKELSINLNPRYLAYPLNSLPTLAF